MILELFSEYSASEIDYGCRGISENIRNKKWVNDEGTGNSMPNFNV